MSPKSWSRDTTLHSLIRFARIPNLIKSIPKPLQIQPPGLKINFEITSTYSMFIFLFEPKLNITLTLTFSGKFHN